MDCGSHLWGGVAVQRISAIKLQNLKPPSAGVAELWDEACRGLCLRVFASGKATWTFRYRPRDGGALLPRFIASKATRLT